MFGPKGPMIFAEKSAAGAVAIKRPFGSRITHALTSHLGAVKLFGGLALLVLLGFAFWWLGSKLYASDNEAPAS